jgi:hypothetical protein
MKSRNVSAKYKRKVKKTGYPSLGFTGILLAAGILFAVLVLNSSAADPSNTSDSCVVNISDIQTLNTNATPGAQDYSRSKSCEMEHLLREAAAERFKANYTAVQGANVTKAAPMPMPGEYLTISACTELRQQPDA